MSFAGLSTELDTRIISFMDHHSLDSMTRVSKYYNQITETHLYRHLEFTTRDLPAIKWLFLVLLDRRPLARYIQSFSLGSAEDTVHEDQNEAEKTSRELLEKLPTIQNVIHEMLGTRASATNEVDWLGAFFLPRSEIDGFVTLILSLASNIERIKLDGQVCLHRTLKTIALPWTTVSISTDHGDINNNSLAKASPGNNGQQRESGEGSRAVIQTEYFSTSFSELRHLRIENAVQFTIPVVPSLESLKVRSSDTVAIRWPATHKDATKLHTIDFQCDTLLPDSLIEGLQAGFQTNVTRLRLVDMRYKGETSKKSNVKHHLLADAMAAKMPKLEYLEWVNFTTNDRHFYLLDTVPFKRLPRFTNLKTLRIDWPLVFWDDHMHLVDPKSILPPNLHTLHLSSILLRTLNFIVQNTPDDPEEEIWIKDIQNVASAFPLRSLSVTVCANNVFGALDTTVSRTTATTLQNLAETLNNKGTWFGVYRRAVGAETVSPRLVAPGFLSEELVIVDDDR